MNERVPAAIAAVSSIVMVVYACATTPATTTTTNSTAPAQQQPVASGQIPGPPPGGQGGFGGRAPLSDSARRVRDSVTSERRDSAAANVLRSIAGHENEPAEQVFKNIKIFKGTPAGQLVNIMNRGFGRSLGVSCGFCHVPGQWDSDQKEEKNTARLMFAMVQTINRDYLAKLPPDNGRTPTASCGTCHRGMPNPNAGQGPPPGAARPATE
jgi:hypothetical protein